MDVMKRNRLTGLLLAVLLAVGARAHATPLDAVAWKVPLYSLTARAMDVRAALDAFGVAQGIPVLCTPAVSGVFSGNFADVPAGTFLDRLTAMHNLVWYFDGTTIFVSTVSESTSTLIDLRYMKADEVSAVLRELGVEDPRFPLKRASNDELIMVYGPPRYVRLVAETIGKVDRLREQRTFTEVETRLFPLTHTWADNVSFSATSPESGVTIKGVAYLLQEMMQSGVKGKVREGTNATENAVLEGVSNLSPVIRPENRLNAVMVRDVVTRMPMYERLIRSLDVPQKLVEIEVTTLELSKDDSLDWQLSVQVSGSHNDFTGAAGQSPSSLFSPSSLSGSGFAGAASYLGSHVDVSASVKALREKGKARNISRTSILTVNNMAAAMTDTQSYHAKVVGTEVATLQEVTAGTRLEIKPRIIEPPANATNLPRKVWLSMSLQDGGFETLTVDAMPMTRSSTLDTQAALPENESLLLAGYFRDIKEEAKWGIPLLRDIPWIGWLFGGVSYRTETVQRLFILTPRVLDAVGPDTIYDQTGRPRDLTREEVIEENLEGIDDERKIREADRDERRAIHEENTEDRLRERKAEIDQNRRERELDRQIRQDRFDEKMKVRQEKLDAREKDYELEKAASETTEAEGEGAAEE